MCFVDKSTSRPQKVNVDRQTLNCPMATLLTMVPPEKKKIFLTKKLKIGAFVQKLSMNKH